MSSTISSFFQAPPPKFSKRPPHPFRPVPLVPLARATSGTGCPILDTVTIHVRDVSTIHRSRMINTVFMEVSGSPSVRAVVLLDYVRAIKHIASGDRSRRDVFLYAVALDEFLSG